MKRSRKIYRGGDGWRKMKKAAKWAAAGAAAAGAVMLAAPIAAAAYPIVTLGAADIGLTGAPLALGAGTGAAMAIKKDT